MMKIIRRIFHALLQVSTIPITVLIRIIGASRTNGPVKIYAQIYLQAPAE